MKRLSEFAGLTLTGATVAAMLIFIPPMGREAATETKPVAAVQSIAQRVEEDSPNWNCMTMGNKVCGPDWKPVTQELADAFAEGGNKDDTTRMWEACLISEGDTSYVVCPDGFVTSS